MKACQWRHVRAWKPARSSNIIAVDNFCIAPAALERQSMWHGNGELRDTLADAIEEAIFVLRPGRYIPQYIRARYGPQHLQQTVPVEPPKGQRCSVPKRPSRNECLMKAGQIRRREP
jgi:hypothetical protein